VHPHLPADVGEHLVPVVSSTRKKAFATTRQPCLQSRWRRLSWAYPPRFTHWPDSARDREAVWVVRSWLGTRSRGGLEGLCHRASSRGSAKTTAHGPNGKMYATRPHYAKPSRQLIIPADRGRSRRSGVPAARPSRWARSSCTRLSAEPGSGRFGAAGMRAEQPAAEQDRAPRSGHPQEPQVVQVTAVVRSP